MFWLCDLFIFKDHLSKPFVSRRYTDVVPLLSKMVCKRVRGLGKVLVHYVPQDFVTALFIPLYVPENLPA